jgi:ribonuclease HI
MAVSNIIEVYTDGSSVRNGQSDSGCGWACKLIYGEHHKFKSGSDLGKTNNQMEMIAVLMAMQSIKDKSIPVVLYSDSKYVIETLKGNYSIRANEKLWMQLLDEKAKFDDIKFIWVKGHNGNPSNEEVDSLAFSEAMKVENDGKESID